MGSSIHLDAVGTLLPPEDANFQRGQVADLLNRQSTKFPGAQPVSFARRHLLELQRDDYFLCEKTDGIRCLLFLTQYYDPAEGMVEGQLLIDRKNDHYAIAKGYLHIPPTGPNGEPPFILDKWHTGTLLDGELVRERYRDGREQLNYLIFDCLALDGENITNRVYDVRIGKVQSLVFKPWKAFAEAWPEDAEAQPFQLKLKEWQLPYGTEMMFRDIIPKLSHGNDGLIFTCKNTPYVSGTDQHILKWKPPQENTVDFRLQLGAFPMAEDDHGKYEDYEQKPETELLVFHGGKDYRHYAMLHLTDDEWEAMKGMNQAFDWRIVECFRDAKAGHWRPKLEEDGTPRFRDDKEHANHVSVVESVLESIEDAVNEQDLIANAGQIRAAWKKREGARKDKGGAKKPGTES